jgi:hypothetical protein
MGREAANGSGCHLRLRAPRRNSHPRPNRAACYRLVTAETGPVVVYIRVDPVNLPPHGRIVI